MKNLFIDYNFLTSLRRLERLYAREMLNGIYKITIKEAEKLIAIETIRRKEYF